MPTMDLSGVAWRKSSYSTGQGNCVEVGVWYTSSHSTEDGRYATVVVVRDSKDHNGSVLNLTRDEWQAFAAAVRNGEFGLM